jgi:hypothetical protein
MSVNLNESYEFRTARQRPGLRWSISRAARCQRQWLRRNAGPNGNAHMVGEFRA